MTTVWSYGGGTQTAAIAVLILQGRLPRPDLIVMADTGREVQATWDYLNTVVRPAGLDVRVIGQEWARWGLTFGQAHSLLVPAFTRQNSGVGQMHTFCSNEWKQRPIRRWLRAEGVTDCDTWLGISTNEMHRMKPSGLNWYRHVYPLIEMVPTNRAGCVSLVQGHGWPTPPKSRCWMCPMMSGLEWQQLKRDEPHNFDRAVTLDAELRQSDPDVYLHRLGLPLDEAVEQTEQQPTLFDGCDSGYCMV